MRILVRFPNHLGDIVIALGFLDVLHRLYPSARIHVLVTSTCAALVENFPHVVRVYPLPRRRTRGLWSSYCYARLINKRYNYTYFFCLPDSFSSAWMGYWLRVRYRVGYVAEFRSWFLTHAYAKPRGLPRVEEYAYLVTQAKGVAGGLSRDLDSLFPLDVHLHVPGGEGGLDRPYAVVNLVSVNSSKTVPLDHAQGYLRALVLGQGLRIICVGTANQRSYYEALIGGLSVDLRERVLNYAGRTTVLQLAQLLAGAVWVLSTDSGPGHLSSSLGRPLVVLMGAASPAYIQPYAQRNTARQTVLQMRDLPCMPCEKNVCRYGLPRCLLGLSSEEVCSAVCALPTE